MSYQSLDKQSKWSLSTVAVLSVTLGVVAGLAFSAGMPEELYVSAPTTIRPVTQSLVGQSVPQSTLHALNQDQYLAEQAYEQEEMTAPSVFVSQQSQWSWGLLAIPMAAAMGMAMWIRGSPKATEYDVESGWAMAASQAELRSRINSVKNSKKITDAMKLVASAKLRRAQESVVQSRPFSEALQGVFGDVIRRVEGTDIATDPLLKERDIKTITLVIIGGDRGLCGGYNNQLIKRSSLRFDELVSQGYSVKCITIGKKVTRWYNNRTEKYPMIANYDCGTAVPKVPELVEQLVASYISGETDTVELLYTNFVSLVKSNPGTRSLLPFKPTNATNQEVDEVCRLTTREGKLAVECEPGEVPKNLLEADMLFEQPAGEILDSLIPLYLNSQLVRTLQESVASELAARMTSMQNASDNAKELGKNLNLQYNRLRQASVTSSLLEICAGATASS
jgi:F-type H+-transporting ATPase subunit gamma